ncbi:MAG: threonylcarbamoyl-AMP synthase [Anaeroplasmataceae bacterium]|nr:threonylcarbamoyl-AMP synthase [Anaeroplasmataceae bacterium]
MSDLIIFPTDTVYGIGCPIFEVESIKKIYELKHRSFDKPLACLCFNLEQIKEIAFVSLAVQKLIEAFMPGALTIILPAKPIVSEKIGYQTIGVRIPNSRLALEILKEMGPMLTTSVNESGKAPLNEYEEIKSIYKDDVDQIYPPMEISSNVSSTVIDCTEEQIRVLREGTITINQINKIWNV